MTASAVSVDDLIPEMVKLSVIAAKLGVHGNTLVEASRREQFVPLVKIGNKWWAKAADVQEWFGRQHAEPFNPGLAAAIRAAGRGEGYGLPIRRRKAGEDA